jgi:hypothetical protein
MEDFVSEIKEAVEEVSGEEFFAVMVDDNQVRIVKKSKRLGL